MKVLVLSDSHGDTEAFSRALTAHPDASHVVFLGDGIRDFEAAAERFPNVIFSAVRGNCDFSADDYPTENVAKIGGIRIFFCHGHTYGVKSGLYRLFKRATELNADIALFGHTHEPYSEYCTRYLSESGETTENFRSVTLFNPGSARVAYDNGGHYGIITIQNGEFLPSHADIRIR